MIYGNNIRVAKIDKGYCLDEAYVTTNLLENTIRQILFHEQDFKVKLIDEIHNTLYELRLSVIPADKYYELQKLILTAFKSVGATDTEIHTLKDILNSY